MQAVPTRLTSQGFASRLASDLPAGVRIVSCHLSKLGKRLRLVATPPRLYEPLRVEIVVIGECPDPLLHTIQC